MDEANMTTLYPIATHKKCTFSKEALIDGDNLVLNLLYNKDQKKLLAEIEQGSNIEYKLHISQNSNERMERLTNQMLWRMQEGHNIVGKYEAHYIIGVNDNGSIGSVSEINLCKTRTILKRVAASINARVIKEKIYFQAQCLS